MRVGDLVVVRMADGFKKVPGIITKLNEPTTVLPYQIASVLFANGVEEDYVTTILEVLSPEKENEV